MLACLFFVKLQDFLDFILMLELFIARIDRAPRLFGPRQ